MIALPASLHKIVPRLLAALLWCAAPVLPALSAGTVLGELPSFENVAISPHAVRLAFVRTKGDSRFVILYSISDHKITHSFRVSDAKLRSIRWADDNFLVVETSSTSFVMELTGSRREWYGAQVIDARSNKVRPVDLHLEGTETMNVVLGTPAVREIQGRTTLLVEGYYANNGYMRAVLFRFDPETGRTNVVAKGEYSWEQWLLGDDGTVLASIDYADQAHHWILKVRTNDRLTTTLTGEDALDPPELLGLSLEPGYAVVRVKEDDKPHWKKLSLSTGKIGDIYHDGDDFEDLLYDHRSSRIIGGRRDGAKGYVFFDPARQKQWDAIAAAYHGANLSLVSYSDDFRVLVVLVDGAELGYYYELFDMNARQGAPIGSLYDGIVKIAEAREITYAASDGRQIPAILTLPRDRPAKGLPLIVFPHGGPSAHDTTHFDWWREAMAERGYAVLQPNYRGSDMDWESESAGFGEWGRKMQTDLSQGVRYLAQQGTIDPARVCIVGASYGGYAALAGITLDPGVYRCAVSVAGLSDLGRFLRWQDANHSSLAVRYWDRYLGVTGPRDPLLDTISPLAHVNAVTVPVLLIHGKDDTVVPFEQSDVFRNALQKAGKPVEFVTLKNEDHWLSRSGTRSQMLESTLDFLHRQNPAD